MVGVSTPPVQPVIVPKVHCSREGVLYFKLYFFFSSIAKFPPQTNLCIGPLNIPNSDVSVFFFFFLFFFEVCKVTKQHKKA